MLVMVMVMVMIEDRGCNNGFDGNGTMPMASTTAVLVVRE